MNIKVLKNKNLLLVIMGQFVSDFGTYMQSFALSLYVLKKTGSATLFASVLVISAIPRILLSPIAGVVVDRMSRKTMIILMDIASGLSVLAMTGVFLLQGELSIIAVYVLVILLSVISVFFSPAMQSMIPDIVKKDQLADANSARSFFESILGFTAPVAAGVLFGVFGLLPIMIINAVSFLLSAASETFIKIEKESLQKVEDREGYFKSLKQGFNFFKSLPEIILMTGVAVIANAALSPIFSIALPIVVLKDFGFSEKMYGVMSSLTSVGMVIAPLFAAKIIKKHHYSKLVWVILSVDGLLCGIMAVLSINGILPTTMYNLVLLTVVINILIMTIVWVNLGIATAMQLLVPGEMRGRVYSVLGMFSMMATPLGQVLMGSLLDISKSYIIMGGYALALLLCGLSSKVGFDALARKGRMDLTVGVTPAMEEVPENA